MATGYFGTLVFNDDGLVIELTVNDIEYIVSQGCYLGQKWFKENIKYNDAKSLDAQISYMISMIDSLDNNHYLVWFCYALLERCNIKRGNENLENEDRFFIKWLSMDNRDRCDYILDCVLSKQYKIIDNKGGV